MLRNLLYFLTARPRRNSTLAALQALLGTAAVFITYRLVVAEVGIEVFGLWSLLLTGASIARLADVSGSSGLARFVAERHASEQPGDAVAYVHTTVLATLGLTIAGSLVVLAFAAPLINWLAPEQAAGDIVDLMPLALLVSLVLPSMSSALCSGLDGTQRADVRAIVMGCSYGVLLGATMMFVGKLGIYGFVTALVLQHLFISVAAWLVLRRFLPNLGWVPIRWSRGVFRETFAFGLKVQANSFAGLLCDPLARVLMAWWGGLAAAGVYELALRLMLQLRAPVVASLQPLMPAAAALGRDHKAVANLVRTSSRHVLLAGLALPFLALLAAPIYSRLMLGHVDQTLVLFVLLLAVGYGANLISVPLFFGAMGVGVMRWNLTSQFVTAACIAILGMSGGWLGGGVGVVLAQVAGLIAGAVTVILGNASVLSLERGLHIWDAGPKLARIAIVTVAFLGIGSIVWIKT
ncbi:oligosaccharide flippase family protein [Paracoccus tibetensis]|uniref:Membrane protein involved in the export of O-antigen and teichoic acid n=1 Tax=Paracoccus tibetensis TaxID=336292 RepID=A0A1G5DQF2_9RHOB|nr:oligosaccharide flippase family protein [Paracoccus tibetensis]SCY16598.1 Membrane protein involved in the export of O-antigen and teichoic acid [Paracoccus tibetensis]